MGYFDYFNNDDDDDDDKFMKNKFGDSYEEEYPIDFDVVWEGKHYRSPKELIEDLSTEQLEEIRAFYDKEICKQEKLIRLGNKKLLGFGALSFVTSVAMIGKSFLPGILKTISNIF